MSAHKPVEVSRWIRVRVTIVAAVFLLAFVGLLRRAWQLQVEQGDALRTMAEDQYLEEIEQSPKRGFIYDREMQELAVDVDMWSIYANPRQLGDAKGVAKQLAGKVGVDARKLTRKLSSKRYFTWVARRVDEATADKVRALNIPGIGFTREGKRTYPHARLASHVIGFAGIDQRGLEGLEMTLDKDLRGRSFVREGFRDSLGQFVFTEGLMPSAELQGDHAVLTIDRAIQFMAARELQAAVTEHKAKGGSVIVLEPKTGEILALANVPDFDPNQGGNFKEDERRNRALTDSFEPGSTMKAMVMAAALDVRAIDRSARIFCENGQMRIGRHTIHDHHPHGDLNLTEVIMYSSNICSAKIGKALGKDRLYDALKAFGFGSKLGVDLPGESTGILRHPRTWGEIGLATVSFGQGVSTTPLQMIAAMAALGNGGLLMKPHVVKRIVAQDGTVRLENEPQVIRRAVSESVAREVSRMMTEVVQAEHGTGKRAAVAGYKVAGKTATAQKVDFVTGGYSKDKRIGSFAGFLPADDPKVAIIVSIDEPEGEPYGGVVAAPAFSRLAEGIMRHLGVAHTEPIVARAPEKAKDAQTAAKDDAAVAGEVDVEDGGDEGDADEVVAAAGEGGEVGGNAFSKSEVVAAPEQGRVMPDLMGRSLRSVIRITSESGLGLYVEGSGHAVVQRPAPGTLVKPGTLVTVRFEPPG